MKCVAELTGDFVVCIVPVAGWEIEKEEREERDRRKSGGADVALAKRERTGAVIFIRGGAGKSTSPRGRRRRPRLVYIRTLDGGQKEQKDREEECVILTTSQSDQIRPCVHIHNLNLQNT